jgi:spermidine synthase
LLSAFVLVTVLGHRRPRFAIVTATAGALAFAVAASRADALDFALARVYASELRLWREEGVQTTVKVNVRPGPDGRPMRVLYVNGWHQANDSPATLFLDRLIGVLPMALHPDPHRALVIGMGGGATPGAIAQFPDVHVKVVELSSAVVQAASRWFAHVNFDLLRRPNASLRIDDGRNYLLLTNERYDLITADVIVPRHSGAGNLYSTEYFQLARRALAADGVMLQWLPGDTDMEHRMLMRTFMGVFPHATLWAGGNLLVGTPGPLLIRRSDFERRLTNPETRAALELAGISSFEMLLLLYNAGPHELQAYVGPGPIVTDDRPLVEYFLSQDDGHPVDLSRVKGDVMRHVER